MSVSRNPEAVEISNKGVGDSGNQNNRHATIENIVDSNNRVTAVVDPIAGAFVDVLVHFF